MASKDCYKTFTTKIISGENERGKYVKFRFEAERPCNCHPETCFHQNGKTRINQIYLEYEDGKREYL